MQLQGGYYVPVHRQDGGGDVADKNYGHKFNDKQGSATRVTCLNHKRRGLTIYAPRISGNHAGTHHSQSGSINSRRTVKPTRGVRRTGQELKTYLHSVKATVYNWISKMKGALIVMISMYDWNLGQTNPRPELRNLCLVNTLSFTGSCCLLCL